MTAIIILSVLLGLLGIMEIVFGILLILDGKKTISKFKDFRPV